MSLKDIKGEHIFSKISMYSCQGNDDNNHALNNNICSYITSSGPSTIFTTFVLLFLVSTVTLDKPLLSIKKR